MAKTSGEVRSDENVAKPPVTNKRAFFNKKHLAYSEIFRKYSEWEKMVTIPSKTQAVTRKGTFVNFQLRSKLSKAMCAVATAALISVAIPAARSEAATTLSVNQTCNGSGGCYPTIQGAIDAVNATDTTIVVAPGTYTAKCNGPACSVASIVATSSNGSSLNGLTLQCRLVSGRSVILDATGLDHAVYVSGLSGVTVQGCVAENAGREGILVEDSTNVTIKRNDVARNDQSLSQTAPCPTFKPPGTPISGGGTVPYCCPDAYTGAGATPGNFPDDNDDCGEGIHLRSVTSSVVQGNFVHNNVGGILMSDETGTNEHNLIVGNLSKDNTLDCGITMASHTECQSGSTDATGCTACTSSSDPGCTGGNNGFGVIHNSVVGNTSIGNGAAGVGAFANPGSPANGGAATDASNNLIANNDLENNGQPGVAIHVHAANGQANYNTIIENKVRGNGGDSEATGSPAPGIGIEVLSNGSFGAPFGGASPIVGTTIAHNKVSNEHIDVWVGNTETNANVMLNNLRGAGRAGVQNDGTGTVTATDNWWNCPNGPGGGGSCSTVTGSGLTISTPYLHSPIPPEK